MDKTVEEIYIVLDELLANIGLQLEEFDMSFLTQAELYVEMFKVMFPTLVPLLDIDFSQEDVNDQELIQSLLDFLSKYIIKMDLDHISGELITKGDPKHILNFIQLLSEISKMIVPKDEGEEEAEHGQIAENYRNFAAERLNKSAPGTYRLTDQSQNSLDEWKYEKYNSAIGIPGEFHVEGAEGEEMEGAQAEGDSGAEDMGAYSGARGGPYPPMKDKYGQGQKRPGKQESLRNSYSGSRISEVSKSKECSDYEMTAKKLSGVDHQFEDFDPKTDPERQKRLEARMPADAEWNGQYGQYEEEEEDEEIVEEADEDEEDEHTESTAKRHSAHKRSDRPKGSQPREEEKYGHEGEEEYEEEEYEEGEGEEYEQEDIDQGEEDYQSYPGRKVSKESEDYQGAEYFASDPINYQSNKRGSSRAAQQEYEEEGEGEEGEEEEDKEEYEDQREAQDMIQEHYDEEDEEGEHMRDEVIEDEAEYYRQQYEAQKMAQARKSKKAARPSTAKPAAYKPGKVEYRPLRPTTAVTYMSHQSVSQARPSLPKPKVKKTKKKTALPMEPMQPMQPKKKPQSKLPKKPKQPKQPRSTSSKNHITEERISERSRESTGQDVRGLQGAQQAGSRRVTSGGSTREENSMQRRNQEHREPSVRYGESLKRRRLTGQGTMQKTGSIRIKGDTLKKAYEDQQKMLYYNIRDSKLNYLKKIHTIIYQLEKEKIKEERELQRSYIKAQEEATVNILLSIKQSYQEKLDVLRQGYKNEKNERKVNDLAQHTFLKTLRHELRLDQMKEIERLKDRLSQEKLRFDLMTGDEAYLERKLAQLYQK